MNRFQLPVLLGALLALTSACGQFEDLMNQGQAAGPNANSVNPYVILDPSSTLKKDTDGSLVGSGQILFNDALDASEPKVDKSFRLKFRLSGGGTFRLVAYCDTHLNAGYELAFSTLTGPLNVVASVNRLERIFTSAFSSYNGLQDVNLQVDLHNSVSPARLIVWNVDSDDREDFKGITPVLDTKTTQTISPGNGTQTRWGLVLTEARLLSAKASDAKVAEKNF